ncbi:hypothetical protein [Cellulomonas denverensis]|uniref:hypothetical protein n=1 Tax=Cellulomonas denverensis TaxID=264297 RepID=UPI0035EEF305
MRAPLIAAGAVLALLLTACGGGTDAGDDTTAGSDDTGSTAVATPDPSESAPTLDLTAGATIVGLPAELGTPPTGAAAGAARTSDDGLITVVTFGSSTCPQVPDPQATGADGTVTVSFPEPTDGPCTLDYVSASSVVALPESPGDGDLTVTIGDWGTVTLPAGSTEAVWVTD